MHDWYLTGDEQANVALRTWGEPFNTTPSRVEFTEAMNAISNFATRKALHGVLGWLRSYHRLSSDDSVDIIHEGRGYGEWLVEATTELAKMLEAQEQR